MVSFLARRWIFWQRAFSSKLRAVTGLIVTVFTAILIVRDGMVNPANRDWFLFKYIPSLPWYWWLIIGVVALAVLSLEGAYTVHAAEHSKLLAKHKQRVSEIRDEYRERLDSKHLGELVESRRLELNTANLKSPESVRPPAAPPLEPNIVYESTDVVNVHRVHRGFLKEGEGPYDHWNRREFFPAAIVTFRNKVIKDRQIGARGHVSARATFCAYDQEEILPANRIHWLGSDESFKVTFTVNDPHSLIVAIFEKGHFFVVQQNTTNDYDNPTKSVPLNGHLYMVFIELISESESKPVGEVELMLDLEKGSEWKPILEQPYRWKRRKLTEITQAGRDLMERQSASETELEPEYREWEEQAARFVATHLGDAFTKRFRPPPHVPPPETSPAFRQLSKALEPVGVYNKTRVKVETLERFQNEIV